jgi:hypothetical protein
MPDMVSDTISGKAEWLVPEIRELLARCAPADALLGIEDCA